VVGLATLSIGFANGLSGIIAARVVLGAGEGAMFPIASRAIAQSVAPELRARVQGITHAFGRIANAATPAIVTTLILIGSWRLSFIVVGLVSVLWAVVWFAFYRDRAVIATVGAALSATACATTTGFANVNPTPATPATPSIPTTPAPVATRLVTVPWLALTRRILPLSMVYFCYGWVFWLFLSWIPQYFVHSQKLDITHSALFSTGVFLSGVAGDLLGGWLSDVLFKRTGSLLVARRYLIAASLFCALLCMLPMLITSSTVAIALCLSGALFFCEIIVGPIWALPMDITPEFTSTATGMMSAGATIAGILSPIAAGLMIDKTQNWTLPFLVAIGVLCAGVVLALRIRPERGLVIDSAALGSNV
jgi:MFS family permease